MTTKRKTAADKRTPKTLDGYAKVRPILRRVLLIDQMIRSKEACNCTQLAQKLEVNRRTIMRDMDFLRDYLGAPIDYDAQKHAYFYREPDWSMPNLRITEGDLFALMVAEQALEAYAGTPWAEKLATVFERLRVSLPDRVEVAPRELLSRVRFDTQAAAVVDPAILSAVSEAVRENRTLRVRYYAPKHQEVREYLLDPYVLRRAHGAWYLAARDHRTGHVPMFNLSRMRAVEQTGDTFDYDESGFDPHAYFDQTFGISQSAQPFEVVIEFSGFAAQLVRERQWHRTQRITELGDGRLRFEAQVAVLDDIWPWVLGWGGEAKVVSPKELADRVAAEAKMVVKQYGGQKAPRGRR